MSRVMTSSMNFIRTIDNILSFETDMYPSKGPRKTVKSTDSYTIGLLSQGMVVHFTQHFNWKKVTFLNRELPR